MPKSKNTKSTQENTSSPIDVNHQIEIDFPALIDLLSNHLYKDKSAVIRELLSNANDSLITRKREFGFADDDVSGVVEHDQNTCKVGFSNH